MKAHFDKVIICISNSLSVKLFKVHFSVFGDKVYPQA